MTKEAFHLWPKHLQQDEEQGMAKACIAAFVDVERTGIVAFVAFVKVEDRYPQYRQC